MNFKPKNREWVKNAAIIFLAALLVLTFFSNTIMNRTLPEVATQYVTDGTVTAKVRGTGTVTANGSHQVKADADREIRSVMVRVGQEVQAGDVLFVLGAGEADELEAAQEQLRQLQISYQKAAINSPTFNYTADERKVDAAYQAWQAALKEVKAAKNKLKDADKISVAEDNLADAKRQLAEIEEKVHIEYNDALTTYNDALKAVEDAQAAVDRLTAEAAAEPVVTDDPSPSPEDAPPSTGPQMDSPESTGQPAAAARSGIPTGKYVTLAAAGPNPELEAAQQVLEDAQKALEEAKEKVDQMNAGPDPRITMAQTLVTNAQAALEAITSGSGMTEYNTAVAAAAEAESAYYDLKDALDAQKESDGKSQALAGLDMADISAQIEKQKQKVEELSGGDGNQITANVSGTVESIECTAGDLKLKGDVLCTIEVPDMGYTLSFSVTNEQARRLSPGDTASVSNYYWGSQIDATLSTIRVDPQKPQTNKLLTFDVEGDVNAGSELTLSVGQRSAGYDVIVPNSSIRSDTNGQFVLAIESKSSPLGNRYIARRVDVEVLAADDINSAVTGDLGYGDYVITTSNAPVNSGDMVRMADS